VVTSRGPAHYVLPLAQATILAALVAFALAPIVWTLLTSVKLERDVTTPVMQYLPAHPSLDNYASILGSSDFPILMRNSVVVASLTIVLSMSFGVLAGYSLSRLKFRARRGVLVFYLLVRMFPAVLMLIPLFIIMAELHLLDTHLGLAVAYTTFALPLVIFVMKNFFDAVPTDLEDAARVDGCSRLGVLVRIMLPLTLPGLGVTALLVFISSWNEFLFALMFTTTNASRTWPVGLQLLVGKFTLPWGKLAAGGIITILPIVVAYLFMGRTLIRGLTAGGVKG
jgi:multiple sugar transport system permease protein